MAGHNTVMVLEVVEPRVGGACHSSSFISQRNLIGATDLLEHIPVCHWLSSDAKSMSCTIYSPLSRNVVRKQDV